MTMADSDIENLVVPRGDLADLIFNAEITDKPVGDEDEDGEQKATIDELASVLLHPEEISRNSKREFARNLWKSFRRCQTFMSILGRFPVVSSENEDHSILFEAAEVSSFHGGLFSVTFGFLTLITVLSTFNILSTMLNVPKHPQEGKVVEWDLKSRDSGNGTVFVGWESIFSWKDDKTVAFPKRSTYLNPLNHTMVYNKSEVVLRAEEMFIFRRNLASLVIILFLLYHVVISDYNLYNRRQFVVEYLSFWTESVEIMQIDAAGNAKRFMDKFLLLYILWFVAFVLALAANFAPVASGAPVSFVFLWIRCFFPSIHAVEDLWITVMRGIGGFVYLYIVLCSKVYILFFLYICKILKTACTVWNERLERVFTKAERQKSRKDKCASRTGFDHLFKDYVTLLDLLSGADTLFSTIIESYFSMTVISIVFEVYYLVRPFSNSQAEFSNARTFDKYVVGIYLFNTVLIFYLVSTGAAEVGEESANGLEIIRRQGIMGHRSDEEMHFMISLYMSYTGHFDTALSGGGYFMMDKAFFVAIAGTVFSYIIIIFQFQPALGLSNHAQLKLVEQAPLIMHVENTFYYREDSQPIS